MLHVPLLRGGQPYRSKETIKLSDYATGAAVAEVSQANAGLVARDLLTDAWTDLQDLKVAEILDLLQQAARHFMEAELPVGSAGQSPEEFTALQSATTGLPEALCRQNMTKIEAAMLHMGNILDGLTGGIDLATLDAGYGQRDGHAVSYAPKARRFGAVLPANSPGVHALWLPALPLKMPLAMKPGQREPWTPLRILEALRAVGFPSAALGYYPSGHDGAAVILRRCGASMMFGAGATVRPWQDDSRVEIHGPGYSKVLIGPDQADRWEAYVEQIVTSIAANGGRSCINASGVWTTGCGAELADALARQLAQIVPLPRNDPAATLAAFADPAIAQGIDVAIERGLAQGGAVDVTARYRKGPRLVEFEGGAYLQPTVVYCVSADHPLASQEYLFPFASVVELPTEQLIEALGPSLVLTALTESPELVRHLMSRSDIGRLNLGPIPTTVIQWDQPHEGNLFEHLYQQRAFQQAPLPATV